MTTEAEPDALREAYPLRKIASGRMPHFVPFVHGVHLLRQALNSVTETQRERVVLVWNPDNFTQEPQPFSHLDVKPAEVWRTTTALSHAQLMTWLLQECRRQSYPWFTWMHHDCAIMGDSLERLEAMAHDLHERDARWGILFTQDPQRPQDGRWNHVDVMAAINVEAFWDVGGWDWYRFPDVFSDYDAYGKLRRAGWDCIRTELPVHHMNGGSQTNALDENRALVKQTLFEGHRALWEARRAELGLEWPPS